MGKRNIEIFFVFHLSLFVQFFYNEVPLGMMNSVLECFFFFFQNIRETSIVLQILVFLFVLSHANTHCSLTDHEILRHQDASLEILRGYPMSVQEQSHNGIS